MHFFKALVGAVALATSVAAQLAFTYAPTNVEEGVPVTFTYTASDLNAPATISLLEAGANVLVITSSATGGSWTWTPPANLVSNTDYTFSISQGGEVAYFGPVVLNSGLEPSSPSAPPVSAPTAPAPPTTTTILSTPAPPVVTTPPAPPVITTMPAYNTTTVIVPPPVNTTIPPPPPFSGAQALKVSFTGLAASFTGLAALLGAFLLVL